MIKYTEEQMKNTPEIKDLDLSILDKLPAPVSYDGKKWYPFNTVCKAVGLDYMSFYGRVRRGDIDSIITTNLPVDAQNSIDVGNDRILLDGDQLTEYLVNRARDKMLLTISDVIRKYHTTARRLQQLVDEGVIHLYQGRTKQLKFYVKELDLNASALARSVDSAVDSTRDYTVEEAAQYLNISVSTIRTRYNKGLLHGYKRGRRLYFTKDELDASGARHNSDITVNSADSMGSDVISVAEAARRTGISRVSIDVKRRSGELPFTRKGRNCMVSLSDVCRVFGVEIGEDGRIAGMGHGFNRIAGHGHRWNNGHNEVSVKQVAEQVGIPVEEVMTASDVASYTGLTQQIIAKKRTSGVLPSIGKAGASYVYAKSDVDKMMRCSTDECRTVFYVLYHCNTDELDRKVKMLYEEYGEPNLIYRDKTASTTAMRGSLKTMLTSAHRGRFDRVCVVSRSDLSLFDFDIIREMLEGFGVETRVLADDKRGRDYDDGGMFDISDQDGAVLVEAMSRQCSATRRTCGENRRRVLDGIADYFEKTGGRACPVNETSRDNQLYGVSDMWERYADRIDGIVTPDEASKAARAVEADIYAATDDGIKDVPMAAYVNVDGAGEMGA